MFNLFKEDAKCVQPPAGPTLHLRPTRHPHQPHPLIPGQQFLPKFCGFSFFLLVIFVFNYFVMKEVYCAIALPDLFVSVPEYPT